MKGDGFILLFKKTLPLLICCGLVLTCVLDVESQKTEEVEIQEYTTVAGITRIMNEYNTCEYDEPIIEVEEVEVVAEPQYIVKEVPSDNSFKSYMDCKYITNVNSPQYKFKYDYLNTASGIMSVDSRYVVAVGTYYATEIGTRIDLVMQNGSVVPCIVGDIKADCHTDGNNQQHLYDKSVVEFIVDTDSLSDEARVRGDCSYSDPRLMGEIKEIRVYLVN